ncbi:MAG TPA: hypothetical protein VF705_11910 [Longimicrobium sp.]|jgi:hypothetical protein
MPITDELIDNGGAVYNARAAGVVGDGVADESPALAALVAAVPARSRVVIPRGTYRLTQTWLIDKALTVDASEATFVVDHVGHGIVFQRTAGNGSFGGDTAPGESLDVRMGTIRRLSATQAGQNADSTGLKVVNSYWGQITFREIQGFRRGLHLLSEQTGSSPKGCVGNDVLLGHLVCEEGLRLEAGNQGWVTTNNIRGGRIGGVSAGKTGPTKDDNITNIRVINNGGIGAGAASNNFFGVVSEGFARHGVVFEGGASRNRFFGTYFEMGYVDAANGRYIINNLSGGFNNEFISGTSLIEALFDGNVADTRGNRMKIAGTHHALGDVTYFDGHYVLNGSRLGISPPSGELTFIGETAQSVYSYSGTPLSLNMRSTHRVRVDVSANMGAGALSLSNGPTTIPYEVELTLNRGGNTLYTVDPDFITGIRYANHPKPYLTGLNSITYRLWVNGTDVQVFGFRASHLKRAVIDTIASAPSYVGELAAVGGVGYMATGTASAADWKQITP